MAVSGFERWYSKWDNLDIDSDGEEPRAETSLAAADLLGCLPKDVASSIARQSDRGKKEALIALNLCICALHEPPAPSPAVQRHLLSGLCEALHGLQEGGEVETLLFHLQEALGHPDVHPQHVELAVGALATLPEAVRDQRIVEVVVGAAARRVSELSAASLARLCWSAAELGGATPDRGGSDMAALLRGALPILAKQAPELAAEDVALVAWACATARPLGAAETLRRLLAEASLPAPGTRDAQVTAWAAESLGICAAPFFGPPPADVPQDLAERLHRELVAAQCAWSMEVLHRPTPLVLLRKGFLSPEEAEALLEAAAGRWRRASEEDGWRSPDVAVLETAGESMPPVAQRARRRVAKMVGLPESHCEVAQVVRCLHGERCREHADAVFEEEQGGRIGSLYLGGQRVATAMVFLSTLPAGAGGETYFPRLGVSVPSQVGSALVWTNVCPSGALENKASYASAPVTDEKASKTYLIISVRAYPLQQEESQLQQKQQQTQGFQPLSKAPIAGGGGNGGPPSVCAADAKLLRAVPEALGDEVDEARCRDGASELPLRFEAVD